MIHVNLCRINPTDRSTRGQGASGAPSSVFRHAGSSGCALCACLIGLRMRIVHTTVARDSAKQTPCRKLREQQDNNFLRCVRGYCAGGTRTPGTELLINLFLTVASVA